MMPLKWQALAPSTVFAIHRTALMSAPAAPRPTAIRTDPVATTKVLVAPLPFAAATCTGMNVASAVSVGNVVCPFFDENTFVHTATVPEIAQSSW